jgi:SH3 domain-containing YSC84-like protein 1
MKALVVAAAAVAIAVGAAVQVGTVSAKNVDRIRDAAKVLREIHAVPDKDIPQELWEKADCVVVIPSLKKGAFIVGGEFGEGLMSCRRGRSWSAPVFMDLEKGSWGLQIGAQSIDLVLLVMNKEGMEKLLNNKVSLGAEASVAAGPVGRDARAGTDAQLKAEILSYSRSKGLFAGIDISGGVMKPDKDHTADLYGKDVDARNVVMTGNVATPPEARPFIDALNRETVATTGKK